jgi:quinol monooxygenase YgiN
MPPDGAEVELTVVTMAFHAADDDRLRPHLARYVVLTREEPGCRNVDLLASATTPSTYVVIQKWESPDAQQAHFDSPLMVDFAAACVPLLAAPPTIDLLEPISAHDLH